MMLNSIVGSAYHGESFFFFQMWKGHGFLLLLKDAMQVSEEENRKQKNLWRDGSGA